MKGNFQSGKKGYGRPRADDPGSFSSSENLDEYIRVSKPGTTIVLAALLVVLVGVVTWGLIGKLPVTEAVKGLVVDTAIADAYYNHNGGYEISNGAYVKTVDGKDVIYCFINASAYNLTQVRGFNKEVAIEMPDQKRITGTIVGVRPDPMTPTECYEFLFKNDWVTERCVTSDYNWQITIEPSVDVTDYEFIIADVTIVTEEVTPISFITR